MVATTAKGTAVSTIAASELLSLGEAVSFLQHQQADHVSVAQSGKI